MNVQTMRPAALATVLIIVVPLLASSQTHEAAAITDNQELRQLVVDDQHDRGNEPIVEYDEHGKRITPMKEWKQLPWDELNKHDAARRKRVRQMLDSGQVQTADDYNLAAFIFQHGESPDDYLLAHILAITAVSKGYKDARWLAASTLDRYLHSIKQPQVYGTQFQFIGSNHLVSKGEYNHDLISDTVRTAMCVISSQKQDEQVQQLKTPGTSATFNTSLIPCP